MTFEEWKDFKGGEWRHEVNVRNFIQRNKIDKRALLTKNIYLCKRLEPYD